MGGLAYALSSVKQEGLTLMAEQTQALELLSEGRDGFTGLLLLPIEGRSCFGHFFLVVFGQGSEGFQVLKLLNARTTDNI